MGRGFLTYTTAVILQAVANGYLYGFDIIDITGVPGGTVYPALRRLEEQGYLTSEWEEPEHRPVRAAPAAQVLRADSLRAGVVGRSRQTLPAVGTDAAEKRARHETVTRMRSKPCRCSLAGNDSLEGHISD